MHSCSDTDVSLCAADDQTNPEHLRQIYQAHLMLQLKTQGHAEYQQPPAIMQAAKAVCQISGLMQLHHAVAVCCFERCFAWSGLAAG